MMVALTVIIGGVNLGLGFALAVYLGYGPPGIREAWEAMGTAMPRPAPQPQVDGPPATEEKAPVAQAGGTQETAAPSQNDSVKETVTPDTEAEIQQQFVEEALLKFNQLMEGPLADG